MGIRFSTPTQNRYRLGFRGQAASLLLAATATVSCASAAAQAPSPGLPPNYKIIFENAAVQVLHVHYAPHERVPVHDHSADPTVYVYLSDSGPVRFTHTESRADGGTGVLTRPPIKAGAFRVSPGRRERHSVENLGSISSDFLRVELKQVPFGTLEAFRGEAPADLTHSVTETEVKTSELEIDRTVCVGAAPCALRKSNAPALLVAFTPVQVGEQGRKGIRLAGGGVQWVPAGDLRNVQADPGEAAYVLRIVLPPRP